MQPTAKQISNHKYKSTIKGRAAVLMGNARARCLDKNISLELSTEWVIGHLERGTCELTGMPFNLEPPPLGISRRPDAPSLDRIDKDKHYTIENTRVILWAVNCALSEYGTDTILPILKAMVAGIENAKKKSVTSVPEGDNSESSTNPLHGIVLASGAWENYDHTYNHSRTVQWQDADHSAKESSGDSVGSGSKEVGTLVTSYNIQNYGEPDAEVIRLEFGRRYLSDKS
jgi:hypothetical protein